MYFENKTLTALGQSMLNNVQGGGAMQFTKIEIGTGTLPASSDLTSFTALINSVIAIESFTKEVISPSSVKISFVVDNQDITEDMIIREVGIFTADPDTADSEILYAVMHSGDYEGNSLPMYTGSNLIEFKHSVSLVVGLSSNVTIQTDDSALIEVHNADPDAHFVCIDGGSADSVYGDE